MKFLIKKSPDSFIKSVNDEINTILNRNFDSLFPEFVYNEDYTDTNKLSMPVELHEHEKDFCVQAELPGVKKEDLDIDIDKNYITINAKKEEEHEEKDSHYKKSEFRYGEFSRTVYFPKDIDVEKTTAKLEHGILKINAPKKEVEKENIKKLTVK
ncbi:Hsp20/alpha crystallin family protein [bacterium]|nr:Hsp20/alpha crystallin family protein [bacterium]